MQKIISFYCLFLLGSLPSIAQEVLQIPLNEQVASLDGYIYYWKDTLANASLEDVYEQQFTKSETASLNFGVTKTVIWLRFTINHPPTEDREWLLEVSYPLLDHIEVFQLGIDSNYQSLTLGDLQPYDKRPFKHRNFIFPLFNVRKQQQTFYIRVDSESSVQIPMHLRTYQHLAEGLSTSELGYGLLYGLLAVMALYNFFIFLSLKDWNYLLYVFAIGIALLLQANFNGHSVQYLFQNSPNIANISTPILMGLSASSSILFSISFLALHKYSKLYFWVMVVIMLGGLLAAISTQFWPYGKSVKLAGVISLLTAMGLVGAGILSWTRGNTSARYYLLAWLGYLSGVFLFGLKSFGVLESSFITSHSMQIGVAFEVVLLSFALSDRYNLYKKEKEAAQLRTLQIQKEANETLEQKVRQRTSQIENQKEELEVQSLSLQMTNNKLVESNNQLSKEKRKSDQLLLNILPKKTAEELKNHGKTTTRRFEEVTVLFTDFKGFTKVSELMPPEELVEEIHYCFSAFDEITSKYNVEKIKTIGDAYMCAAGLPEPRDNQALDAVRAALEIAYWMDKRVEVLKASNRPIFEIRIGLHTGPVVAGVVGTKKFAYDIWGDTVNTASRMESSGEAGRVNISGYTYKFIKDKFKCEYRGKVQAKNKGEIDMYFVNKEIGV